MLAGRDVMSEPLSARRELLGRQVLPRLSDPISPQFDASLPDLIRAVREQGLEPLVAKRLDRFPSATNSVTTRSSPCSAIVRTPALHRYRPRPFPIFGPVPCVPLQRDNADSLVDRNSEFPCASGPLIDSTGRR